MGGDVAVRLVISMMTAERLSDHAVATVLEVIGRRFTERREVHRFEYAEWPYSELSVDLFDVASSAELLDALLGTVIGVCEQILVEVGVPIDFIIESDDNYAAVERYEKDWNDVGNVGLFVTPRVVPGLTPYFSSEVCRAYVNLEHVSFGVYG